MRLELVQLPRQRTGIGHGAREDLHGHRPALLVAQPAKVDLLLALLAVTIVAELGQVGAEALHVRARDVTEYDSAFCKVTLCQLLFYGLPAGKEPVHGLADLVLVHRAESELLSQAAGLAFLLERRGGGELAAGTENARCDEGKYDVALPGALAVNDVVELQIAERAEGSGDVTGGSRRAKGKLSLRASTRSPTTRPPLSRSRIWLRTASGSWVMLARVILRDFPSTHLDSRMSQVGLEPRLGIRSTYRGRNGRGINRYKLRTSAQIGNIRPEYGPQNRTFSTPRIFTTWADLISPNPLTLPKKIIRKPWIARSWRPLHA